MNPEPEQNPFGTVLDSLDDSWGKALEADAGGLHVGEVGTVQTVQAGVAIVSGLPGVKSEELVEFPGGLLGMAFDLTPQSLGVILLDHSTEIEAGDPVRRTGRVMDIPVGDAIIGRVVDAVGRPRDNRGRLASTERLPIEREAPAVLDRAPVEVPLQTGIKVVDALVPIGRGQRELIVGDRQTGKTSIAIDAIINQANSDVVCIYCAIGQRSSSVAGVLQALRDRGAMDYTTAIVATGDDPAGLRWAAPYSAMSVGEYFMANGRDVLVVIDDLTRHARSYRELSLLLRRPPGREAYPGDIFYVHSRLLERATHLREEHGGGSLTALPIIETQAQNISAYIPTNLISITDGQVYLSPNLYQQGQLPAVDVGRSVSRVGGKAQLKAFRETSGDLRLSYSQFEELERFSRYGTRLQEQQQKQLDHGLRVRQVLRQNERDTRTVMEQVAMLFIVTEGMLDETPSDRIGDVEKAIREAVKKQMGETAEKISDDQSLSDDAKEQLKKIAADCIRDVTGKNDQQSDEEE